MGEALSAGSSNPERPEINGTPEGAPSLPAFPHNVVERYGSNESVQAIFQQEIRSQLDAAATDELDRMTHESAGELLQRIYDLLEISVVKYGHETELKKFVNAFLPYVLSLQKYLDLQPGQNSLSPEEAFEMHRMLRHLGFVATLH